MTLQPLTRPSIRHPDGLPRCQRVRRTDDGRLAQCRRVAVWQLGSRVCGMHGATWLIRVQRGERKNPITARLVHGRRSKDSTLGVAFSDPNSEGAVLQECTLRSFRQLCRTVDLKCRCVEGTFPRRPRGRPSRAEQARQQELWLRRALGQVDSVLSAHVASPTPAWSGGRRSRPSCHSSLRADPPSLQPSASRWHTWSGITPFWHNLSSPLRRSKQRRSRRSAR